MEEEQESGEDYVKEALKQISLVGDVMEGDEWHAMVSIRRGLPRCCAMFHMMVNHIPLRDDPFVTVLKPEELSSDTTRGLARFLTAYEMYVSRVKALVERECGFEIDYVPCPSCVLNRNFHMDF